MDKKGGEDSFSILPALLGKNIPHRPLFHNDHKETADNAACALRLDDPEVNNELFPGQWKLLFDGPFIRYGEVKPLALFNLAADPKERANQLLVPELKPLINYLSKQAIIHRNSGGHRMAELADGKQRVIFDWTVSDSEPSLSVHVTTEDGEPHQSEDGLGIKGENPQVWTRVRHYCSASRKTYLLNMLRLERARGAVEDFTVWARVLL